MNHQCEYSTMGIRCQAIASMSHSVKGEGPWFCRDHFWGKPMPKHLDKDWRDTLIEARMILNFDDYRQVGEAKSDYRQRMMDQIRSKLGNIAKLPYDKTLRDEEREAIVNEYSSVPF